MTYAVEEEVLDHSPAAYVRRPRLDYESHAVALDRNELGALLVAAGLGPPPEHALISLLASARSGEQLFQDAIGQELVPEQEQDHQADGVGDALEIGPGGIGDRPAGGGPDIRLHRRAG
jgi:hypothetical protein